PSSPPRVRLTAAPLSLRRFFARLRDSFSFGGGARLSFDPNGTVLFLKKKNQKDFRAHPYGMLWPGLTAYARPQPRP
ncbi:hypothetical protein, partial [uncultured Rikenella sp.]|uniref:hypothetical protein n=1 Tax=uncultured Rikenella sp. TaxID=368003 RepID=UPI00260E87F6